MLTARYQAQSISWSVGPLNARKLRCVCRAAKACDSQPVAERRQILQFFGAASLSLIAPNYAWSAGKGQTANVGSYLPELGDGFVQFKPSDTQTPASRTALDNDSQYC